MNRQSLSSRTPHHGNTPVIRKEAALSATVRAAGGSVVADDPWEALVRGNDLSSFRHLVVPSQMQQRRSVASWSAAAMQICPILASRGQRQNVCVSKEGI